MLDVERAGTAPFGADSAHKSEKKNTTPPPVASVMFMAPQIDAPIPARKAETSRKKEEVVDKPVDKPPASSEKPEKAKEESSSPDDASDTSPQRRRRGRRGRGRRPEEEVTNNDKTVDEPTDKGAVEESSAEETAPRRRRRRIRQRDETPAEESSPSSDEEESSDDEVRSVRGSVRLQARRQRRRDGRQQRRERPSILTEAEFLARRESVERVMLVRQRKDMTQVAVLEDEILVEHYVTRSSSTSYVGNVYLGKVQTVLPSMEAAFIDIGKGRNAVLYAGEVNWDEAALEGKTRKIEKALKSGDTVMVQVTKDPIGHKGARLTSQISLPGRFLVYMPTDGATGISRKLPDIERKRLKEILASIVPQDAGVIIRTAAEGATEEELTRDVARLKAQWEALCAKSAKTSNAPTLLYEEPDLVIRVIRDIFNEDFRRLVVQGEDAQDLVEQYVAHVAPELSERVESRDDEADLFAEFRVDEQLAKALDRKVWLPSGGSLVFDSAEAMTVVDVNTGRFTGGKGANLEETITRNNLEAAEEIARQLRLRDLGGIVVIDFVDMVLESNRELVLRRFTECLGRDRTRNQVSEVTSLGLVQMTRKRIGTGLLEAFSEKCEACGGRGVIVHTDPVVEQRKSQDSARWRKEKPQPEATPM